MAVFSGPEIVNDDLVLHLDAANPKSFSPNTFPLGQDIYGWYVPLRGNATGNGCTVERDYTISKSPAKGIPLKMIMTGTGDPHIGSYNAPKWNISTAVTGQTWRVSVYAKSSVPMNNCELYIFGANSLGSASIAGGGWYGITSKVISVTTEWQRFDHFITFNNAEVAYIQMRLDGPNQTGLTGEAVWWDGLQVEPYSVTDFNPLHNQNYSLITDLKTRSSGTLYGYPEYSTNSLVLDGVYDEIVTTLAVPLIKDLTIDFWFKSAAQVEGRGAIAYGGATYGIIAAYRLKENYCSFYFATEGGTTILNLESKNLADNSWHNLVVTYNGTTGSVFVDGILELTTSNGLSGNLRTTSNFNINIGRWSSSAIYQDMEISLVKIYNRELTLQEISQNFEATRSRYGI